MTGPIDSVASSFGTTSALATASTVPTSASITSQLTSAPLRNPQVIQDPVAGFITQYMDKGSGQIVSQAPSAVTVAYLRQGLSANGMPKQAEISRAVTA